MNLLKGALRRMRRGGIKSVLLGIVTFVSNNDTIMRLTSCQMPPDLPESTQLPHPTGIAIHPNAEIGERVTIYQSVTIGIQREGSNVPKIEDDVTLYAGCVIVGDVTIGEGSLVGANAVVLEDIPPRSVAAGIPAEVVSSR